VKSLTLGTMLQGGYDLKALSESVCDSFRGVLGLPSEDKFNPQLLREEPMDKVRAVVKQVQQIHGL
jgi:acetoin utilization deacetylase AcuC-like enzyme